MLDKNYVRYSDDFPAFRDECKEQAESKGYHMDSKTARAIWTELQVMSNPHDFRFDENLFDRHSRKIKTK